MIEQRIVINGLSARHNAHAAIDCVDVKQPAEMILKPWQPKRSLSANALYWQWMNTLAKHVSTPAGGFIKDDLHDICRHKFLGYRSNGKRLKDGSQLPAQLKSTSSLKRNEFCYYMTQVDAWAASLGCLLPRPDDCEYQFYLDDQETA